MMIPSPLFEGLKAFGRLVKVYTNSAVNYGKFVEERKTYWWIRWNLWHIWELELGI